MKSVHAIANEDDIAEGFVQDAHDFTSNQDRYGTLQWIQQTKVQKNIATSLRYIE